MYSDVGKKILTMASAFMIISILGFAIIGIYLWIGIGGMSGFMFFLLILCIGIAIAWMLNLLLAGFGELISNTHELLTIVKNYTTAISGLAPDNVAILHSSTAKPVESINAQINQTNPSISESTINESAPLIRHAFFTLEDGDWVKANELFDKALNLEPENARVYIGKLCAELQLKREEDLLSYNLPIDGLSNYRRALKFADNKYKTKIERYALTTEQRCDVDSSEMGQIYETIISKIEAAEKRKMVINANSNDDFSVFQIVKNSEECKKLIADLMWIDGYRDSSQILNRLLTPVLNGDSLVCSACGCKQQANRQKCFRCGIEFIHA